jgi:hypothetical protein
MDLALSVYVVLVYVAIFVAIVCAAYRGRKRVLVFIAALFVAHIVYSTAIFISERSRYARVPLDKQTMLTISTTVLQTQRYIREHGSPPPALSAIPERRTDVGAMKDAWGRELLYDVGMDGVVTIRSYGADGKPGGSGLDRDIICRFRSRNADGSPVSDDVPTWDGIGRRFF